MPEVGITIYPIQQGAVSIGDQFKLDVTYSSIPKLGEVEIDEITVRERITGDISCEPGKEAVN